MQAHARPDDSAQSGSSFALSRKVFASKWGHHRSRRPPLEGLIFDLDGTLADTFVDLGEALNATRRAFGMMALPHQQLRMHIGWGAEYLVRELVPGCEGALECFLDFYRRGCLRHTRLRPGAHAILQRFAGRPMAVVTNKPIAHTERILGGLGIRRAFELVLGGDSLPQRKPHPLPIEQVLRSWQLPANRVVLIGDGVQDLQAAHAARVRALGVLGGVGSPRELARWNPERILTHLGLLALHFS